MQNPILLIAILVFLPSPSLKPENFRVLVLDAMSGKPQSKMQVDFYCRDSRHNSPPEEDDTDDEGIVVVPYECKGAEPKIVIDVTGLPKEQCGSSAVTATFEEISATGIISAPDAAGEMQVHDEDQPHAQACPGTGRYLRKEAKMVAVPFLVGGLPVLMKDPASRTLNWRNTP